MYQTVMIDPPWPYRLTANNAFPTTLVKDGTRYQKRASSSERYGAMTLPDLAALPFGGWVGDHAHLYLWTTNSFLNAAFDLCDAWGFDYKTTITWGKTQDDGEPSRKMGYWYRSATEHCVFAVRGQLRLVNPDPAPSTLFLHRRLPHSVKPDAFYDMVERYSPGPYLDVFSRRARLGWVTWGDEALHGM